MGRMSPGSSSLPSSTGRSWASLGTTKGTFGSPFFRPASGSETAPAATLSGESAGLPDAITLQTLRAHPNTFRRTLDQNTHRLEIGIPAPLASIVGVAHVVAGDRPLGAHGAYPCHISTLFIRVVTQRARKTNEPSRMTQLTRDSHRA